MSASRATTSSNAPSSPGRALTGPRTSKAGSRSLLLGVGAATAAAHIGNSFTTYLIGGLMDRFGFTPLPMAAYSMVETLCYAAAMFLVAPRVAASSPRLLMAAGGSRCCVRLRGC